MTADIVLRFAAFGWFACFCANLAAGARQRTEGGGTILRYLWVCGALAAIESLPLLAAWWLAKRGALSGPASTLTFCVTLFACLYGMRILGPPLQLRGRRVALPLAEAPGLVERVETIAHRLKIRQPRVRLLEHFAGGPLMLAWAGGLVAPSVAVTGGLLARLPVAEVDAILAHELAHISTGSLWFYPAVAAASSAAAVVSTAWLPAGLAAAWGWALFAGLSRLSSRRFEILCDRGAARAIGHEAAYRGLGKVHVAHPLSQGSWLTYAVHAVSTHPSEALRLNAIWRDAPEEVRNVLSSHEREARRDHGLARVALVVWLLAISLPWVTDLATTHSVALTILFIALGLSPLLLMIAAMWKQIRVVRRRQRVKTVASRLYRTTWPFLLVGIVLMFARWNGTTPLAPLGAFVTLFGCACLLLAVFIDHRNARLRRDIQLAVWQGDFARVRSLYLQQRAPTRDPFARQLAAAAAAVLDDPATAESELEALIAEGRGPAGAEISLGVLRIGSQPERALEHLRSARQKLPGDAGVIAFNGWALIRLGRYGEAEAHIEQARQLSPREGWFQALLAESALRQGDIARAESLLVTALEMDPGGAHPLLLEARLRLARGEDADDAIEAATKSAAADPFALLQPEIAELRRHLRPIVATLVADDADPSPASSGLRPG